MKMRARHILTGFVSCAMTALRLAFLFISNSGVNGLRQAVDGLSLVVPDQKTRMSFQNPAQWLAMKRLSIGLERSAPVDCLMVERGISFRFMPKYKPPQQRQNS